MKRMIIRADDLGYCEAVNYGIEKSVREGIVRCAGLMPNMESAAHGVGADGVMVMICHPGYVDDYLLKTSLLTTRRAEELAMLISKETKQWLGEHGICLVRYDQL